jgi:hypothetical protein
MRPRIRRGRLGLYLSLLLIGGLAAFALYAYDVGFNRRWRTLIERELEPLGLRAEIGRLTLDPVDGLTARNVRLFDLLNPSQRLVDINRISLDVDVARLVDRRDFLRSLTLDDANVSLPVTPDQPDGEWLTIRNFNARLIVHGRQIEIPRADGIISGIRFTARGDVEQPEPSTRPEPGSEAEKRWKEDQARLIHERRLAVSQILRVLDRFQPPAGSPSDHPKAEAEIEIHGPLSEPENLRIEATLRSGPFTCGNFSALEMDAESSFRDGEFNLRRLHLRDRYGSLSATASWKPGSSSPVPFAIDSSVDLVALAKGIAPDIALPDQVVFHDPPKFEVSGRWDPTRKFSWPDLPLDVTGQFTSGSCSVKGENYSAVHADFAARSGGFAYLRNVRVEHESGQLSGQILLKEGSARAMAECRLPIRILLPFLNTPAIQKQLALCEFGRSAQLTLSASASSESTASPATWLLKGHGSVRDFRLRGVPVSLLTVAEISARTGTNPVVSASNAVFRLAKGDISIGQTELRLGEKLCLLRNATCTVMPVEAVSMFAPKAVPAVGKYVFSSPPRTETEGSFDMSGPDRHDFTVRVQSPDSLSVPIGRERWSFNAASGWLRMKGTALSLDLAGRTLPDTRILSLIRFPDPMPTRIAGSFSTIPGNAAANTFTVRTLAPETTTFVTLGGRDFPFSGIDCTLNAEGPRLRLSATAGLFSGNASASLDFPEMSQPSHAGSVSIERVSYPRVRGMFTSTPDQTGGNLTGRMSYQMTGSTGDSIEGTGNATLEDGNIFALPLLGPLSTIINALLPGENIAYSVARKATASFRVSRGRVSTPDFEAATRTFRLTVDGTADLVNSHVDFNARVNLRGAPGLILLPVSKLFEYKADGTLSDPHWHARHLPLPFRRNPREKEAREAEQKRSGTTTPRNS